MDVYQKLLLKIYEKTGGKETVDLDFAELLKKEGFYPSLPSILEHLIGQGWITETSRKNVIRLTHWGTQAAKKLENQAPGEAANAFKKDATRLLSETRELVGLIEELLEDASPEKFTKIELKVSEINAAIAEVKVNI